MTNREAIEIADKAYYDKITEWRAKNSATTPLPFNLVEAWKILEAMKNSFKNKLDVPYDKACQIVVKL